MTGAQTGALVLGCGALELAAWPLLVPETMTATGFLLLNLAAAALFVVGFASAASGRPTRSVRQILSDLDTDRR